MVNLFQPIICRTVDLSTLKGIFEKKTNEETPEILVQNNYF